MTSATVREIPQYLATVFSGLTLAAVVWFGTTVIEIDKAVSIHEYRIDQLEDNGAEQKKWGE